MISVASSISIPMSNTNKTMYDSLKSHINSLELKTHKVVTSEGATLYLAFKRDNIDPVGYNDSLNHIRYCCDHLNHIRYCSENSSILCNLCAKGFIHDYAPLVFNNKKTLLGSLPRDSPILLHIQSLDSCFSTIFGTYVVIDGPIGTKHFGGFEHLYVELPNCYLKKFTVDDYNWFINQHYPTIRRLIKENDNDGIIESLKLLQSLLPKITYGDNIQQSTEWFLKYMMEYRSVDSDFERDMVIMKALLNQYMLPGHGSERIVATNLKQTKDTVLEAMSCAHNESALVKLLTNLFNPTTYMRPTAAPSEGNIKEAMKIFENANFSTTVMTVDNLISKYGGKAVPEGKHDSTNNDAMSAWGSMRDSIQDSRVKGKRGGASGFAKRAGTNEFTAPTTVVELFERLNEFPGLEIMTYSMSPTTLTEYPDTSSDLLKHPFLWSFHNGKSVESCYSIPSGYHKVNAMTSPGSMGRNVFFGLHGVSFTGSTKYNTCFPTFLKEAVQRKCRSAFEKLNTTTTAAIPSGCSQLAYGVGTSRTDSLNGLYSILMFRYKSSIFTISKWG
jgi:hypothetical protein